MSALSIFSFIASLLAAGLLMADLNYTMESNSMKAQQTPGVHPMYGFLRASARGQAALFLSSWAFLSAYLACTVFAFGCLLVTRPWWVFFAVTTTEYWALAAFKAAQGEFAGGGYVFHSLAVDLVVMVVHYISMSSAPFFQLRVGS